MGKQRNEQPVIKPARGFRRHNRSNNRGSVDQSRQHSTPKWHSDAHGVLSNGRGNYIQRSKFNNRWVSTNSSPIRPVATNVGVKLEPVEG